jgi:hypothetical protein
MICPKTSKLDMDQATWNNSRIATCTNPSTEV